MIPFNPSPVGSQRFPPPPLILTIRTWLIKPNKANQKMRCSLWLNHSEVFNSQTAYTEFPAIHQFQFMFSYPGSDCYGGFYSWTCSVRCHSLFPPVFIVLEEWFALQPHLSDAFKKSCWFFIYSLLEQRGNFQTP